MDIDPPPHKASDPSDEELQRLGLPTHHVHYSSVNGQLVEQKEAKPEEILRPNDITVLSYQPEATGPKALASTRPQAVQVSFEMTALGVPRASSNHKLFFFLLFTLGRTKCGGLGSLDLNRVERRGRTSSGQGGAPSGLARVLLGLRGQDLQD